MLVATFSHHPSCQTCSRSGAIRGSSGYSAQYRARCNVGVLALLGPSLGLPAGNALLVLGGMLATLMTVSTLLIDAMNSYGLTARSSLVAANVGLVGLLAFVGLIQILDNELTAAVAGTAGGFATSCVMAAWLLRRTPKPEGGVRTEFDLLRQESGSHLSRLARPQCSDLIGCSWRSSPGPQLRASTRSLQRCPRGSA